MKKLLKIGCIGFGGLVGLLIIIGLLFGGDDSIPSTVSEAGPTQNPTPTKTERPANTPRPTKTKRSSSTPVPTRTPTPAKASDGIGAPRSTSTPRPTDTPKQAERVAPIVILEPTSTPQDTATPEPTPRTMFVIADGAANVRGAASGTADVVGTLGRAAPVQAFEQSGEWIRVAALGLPAQAWIHSTLVADTEPTPLPPTEIPELRAALRITRLRYSTNDEFVEITNQGTAPQDMTGWRLQSVKGDQWYSFPHGHVLGPGAVVRVHSGSAAVSSPPTDLHWVSKNMWNNEGDEAKLYNAQNDVVDSRKYS